MQLKKVYNKVSNSYKSHLNKKVFEQSSQAVIQQIKQINYDKEDIKIMDLGAGHGDFLQRIFKLYNKSILFGIDLSGFMLAKAKKTVSFNAIEGRLEDAPHYVDGGQFDLVASHFICCYVGLPKVIELANYLLNENGVLSLCTTTAGAWPILQDLIQQQLKSNNPFKRILFKQMHKGYSSNKLVPLDFDQITQSCKKLGFEIIAYNNIAIDLNYRNINDLINFFLRDGWGAHARSLPLWISRILGGYAFSGIKFPLEDIQRVSICLIRKK